MRPPGIHGERLGPGFTKFRDVPFMFEGSHGARPQKRAMAVPKRCRLIGLRLSGKAARNCLQAPGNALCEFRAALSLRHQPKVAGRLVNDLLCIRSRKNTLLDEEQEKVDREGLGHATAIADGCLVQSWPETDISSRAAAGQESAHSNDRRGSHRASRVRSLRPRWRDR